MLLTQSARSQNVFSQFVVCFNIAGADLTTLQWDQSAGIFAQFVGLVCRACRMVCFPILVLFSHGFLRFSTPAELLGERWPLMSCTEYVRAQLGHKTH